MNVVLTGVPGNVKLRQLVFLFRPILKQVDIEKFWIKEIYDIPGTDTKGARFEFQSLDEANCAAAVLDRFVYRNRKGQNRYPLSARTEDIGPGYCRSGSPGYGSSKRYQRDSKLDRDRERYGTNSRRYSRERYRSRSPHLINEASKLDLEIELLKKKRMIIEEERRLLMERKKLEMVKEFGPSAVKDIEFIEGRDRDRRHREREEPMRQTHHPPRSRDKYVPTRQLNNKEGPKKDKPVPYQDRLPSFYAPCNKIMASMKEVIKNNVTSDNKVLFYQLLRTTLRKRFTIALSGQRKRLTAKGVVNVYRECHPVDTDELLVKTVLDDIKACDLSESTVAKSLKAGKKVENVNQENARKVVTCASDKSTSVENGSTISGQETKQEDMSAEVNKIVETDTTAAKVITKPEEVKDEAIKQDTSSENAVIKGKAHRVAIDKNAEYGLSMNSTEVATAMDKSDEDWDEGDDWNDLEIEESEEMTQE